MDYYDYKLRRRTADMKPYFSVLAVFLFVLLIGVIGQCCHEDEVAVSEAKFSEFDRYRAAEIMSRQLGTKVEKDYKLWKEKN